MKTIKFKNGQILYGYEFEDFDRELKDKIICDHIKFWIDYMPYEETTGNLRKAIDEAERLQTPWFTGGYIYDYCKEEIIEEIKLNNYLFNDEGNLLPITYYTRNSKVTKIVYGKKEHEIELA